MSTQTFTIQQPAGPSDKVRRAQSIVARGIFARIWEGRHLFLALTDLSIIIGSILLSYTIRFNVEGLSLWTADIPDLMLYMKSGVLLAAIWMYGLWQAGAYERGLRGVSSPVIRLRLLMKCGLYALAAVMAVGFMYRELLLSRQVYITTVTAGVLGMVTARSLFNRLDRYLAKRGYVTAQIAIIGVGSVAHDFAASVERETGGSIRVSGFIHTGEPSENEFVGRPLLGNIQSIESIHSQLGFTKLVLATPLIDGPRERRGGSVIRLLNFCEQRSVALYVVPDSFDVAVTPSEIASFSGTPLVRLKDSSLHPMYAITKRLMDVIFATTVLVLGIPLWVAIVVALRLSSPGPVIFSQWRAGHHGAPFRMFKFRSMTIDAESRLEDLIDIEMLKEPVFKIRNDPRVTNVGRWLRRLGLDEVPQFLNVLKGDMSIVGPRPEETALVEKYDQWQRRRLKAKPGITGYQQIKNRGSASLAERVKYDLVYLKHQSLALDLYILLKTPMVVIRGSGTTH